MHDTFNITNTHVFTAPAKTKQASMLKTHFIIRNTNVQHRTTDFHFRVLRYRCRVSISIRWTRLSNYSKTDHAIAVIGVYRCSTLQNAYSTCVTEKTEYQWSPFLASLKYMKWTLLCQWPFYVFFLLFCNFDLTIFLQQPTCHNF
jgi:hypothetical protein